MNSINSIKEKFKKIQDNPCFLWLHSLPIFLMLKFKGKSVHRYNIFILFLYFYLLLLKKLIINWKFIKMKSTIHMVMKNIFMIPLKN